jgi:hypothetical protein
VVTVNDRKEIEDHQWIIPGDWGKAESGWLARPLMTRFARAVERGRIHQSLWRFTRAASSAMQGLRSEERTEAAPS